MPHKPMIFLVLTLVATNALAAPQTIVGPAARVSVMELYTSEGCDSCPPAEHWLSGFTADKRLWKELVPLAFHVTYWDDLGWKDPFDSRAYTLRQQLLALRAGSGNVYTPEFVLNGAEWQNWFNHWPLQLPDPVKVGSVSLAAEGRRVRVHFAPAAARKDILEAHVVLLAFGVAVHVGAGENAGAVLDHDFLVLSLSDSPMVAKDGGYETELTLPASGVRAGRYGLAAWISSANDPTPIQAAGGWLDSAP